MRKSYNDRLFLSNRFRRKLHLSRFLWLQKNVTKYCNNVQSVLELGCFDAKTIDYLPGSIKSYHGFDAGWGGGLTEAKKLFKAIKDFSFTESSSVDSFRPDLPKYDISICMETLEHIPIAELEKYLEKMSEVTNKYCFITVPNEKGIVLIVKFLVKKLIFRDSKIDYSFKELFYGLIGKMKRVRRIEKTHKGFDYVDLLSRLKKHFSIERVQGIPFTWAPLRLNFTIGIVLKKKK